MINTPIRFYILMMVIFYLPGFFISLYFDSIYLESLQLLLLFLVSLFFTLLGSRISKKSTPYKLESPKIIILIAFIIYITCLIFIFLKNPIALFQIGNTDLISEFRENATKGKTGFDAIVNLIYYSTSYFALPLIVLKLYHHNHKYKHFYFCLILLSLLFTLEKARAFIIFIPLMFYLYMKFGVKKTILALTLFISLLLLLSLAVGLTAENLNQSDYSKNFEQRAVNDESKLLFENPNTITFVINRVVWIPYITAIDWLKFNDQILKEKLLYGRTISIVGDLFYPNGRYKIENEIYKFQFNAPDESLGSSNSHFALDAFLNFGWIGVAIYSFLFGYSLAKLYYMFPSPYNFAFYNYAFSATVANLHSIFLGGGLIIFVLTAIFLNTKNHAKL